MQYPLPSAHPEEVVRTQNLYRDEFGVPLTYVEAKNLLEGVMQFIYLTEIEAGLAPLREEADKSSQGEGGDAA